MGLWTEVRYSAVPRDAVCSCPTAIDSRSPDATVSRRDMIQRAFERVSLLEYITGIFCFTEIGARKDSPEFWLRVLLISPTRPG